MYYDGYMKNEDEKESLAKVAGEHIAGTVIIASAMAGVGALVALKRGGSVRDEAALAAIMGTVSGLGFGRTVYKGLFGWKNNNLKAREPEATWAERVNRQEKSQGIRR